MSRTKKKGCNPLVGILILGGILLIGLVSSLFVGKIMLNNWIKGDGLQALLQRKAAASLHSSVVIDEVKWQGMKAFVGKFSARGYEQAPFSSLELNAVRLDINGVKNNAFEIPAISVSQATAEFSNDRLKDEPIATPVGDISEEEVSREMPDWLKSRMPNRTEIGEIVIASATLEVKDDQGVSSMAIRETRATINPELDTGVMEIRAQGGKLLFENAPDLNIRDSRLRFQGSNLFINDIALEVYDGGHISGVGEIAFEEPPLVDLDLKVSGVDIKKVVNDNWKSKVSGTVRGPVKVTGTTENMTMKGTLHLENGVLESIPVLDKIGQYTKSKRFSRLVLNQAQADFTVVGEQLELRNIQIESDGLTRVEGALDKNGEALAGVLNIGVTPGTLRWIPGAERSVFTEKRDGFVWTTMNIGGTTAQIREDLSGRLMTAAAMDIVDKLPVDVQDKLKGFIGLGGNSTQPPADGTTSENPEGKNSTDRVRDLIIEETGETGRKLIEGLGKSLFGN